MFLSQDVLVLVSKLAASLQLTSPLSPPPRYLGFLQPAIILALRNFLNEQTLWDGVVENFRHITNSER